MERANKFKLLYLISMISYRARAWHEHGMHSFFKVSMQPGDRQELNLSCLFGELHNDNQDFKDTRAIMAESLILTFKMSAVTFLFALLCLLMEKISFSNDFMRCMLSLSGPKHT